MDDPTEAIDQELAIEHFHLFTTYNHGEPPIVSIVATVRHEADVTWVQQLTFTRDQLEQLVMLLHHTVEHDDTGLVWP